MNISDLNRDKLAELLNIASGRAARALSTLMGRRVQMNVIDIHIMTRNTAIDYLQRELKTIATAMLVSFHNSISGQTAMLLNHQDAVQMVRALLGGNRDLKSLSAAEQSVLEEIANIVLNACVGSLADHAGSRVFSDLSHLLFNVPAEEIGRAAIEPWGEEALGILFVSRFSIGEIQFHANILLVTALGDAAIQALLKEG